MQKIGLHIFALVGALLVTQAASAGVLLEPYLAYESGNINATSVTGADGGGSTTALDFGARVGYKLPIMLWFAADYTMVTGGKFKPSSSSYDFKGSDLWLDVGIDLPVLLRLWAGYGIQNSRDIDVNGISDKYTGGTNLKVGAGFTFWPMVSINLEYVMLKPTDNEYGTVGNKSIDTYYKSYDQNALMIGVSLPFDL